MITQEKITEHHNQCEEAKKSTDWGPWKDEPNRVNWVYKDMDCMMVRHARSLHWCGYVGLPETHLYHGKSYGEIENTMDVSVHGGLTYADACNHTVCHITDKADNTWWLGFDCAHTGDVCPTHERIFMSDGYYKDLRYVKAETERLADQFLALSGIKGG